MNTGLAISLVDEIITLAKQHNIDKIILFGSRARGDYNKVSDIDIAVTGEDVAGFSIDIEEETNTLLKFDVVNLDGTVQNELLQSINKEGIVLYEKV